MRVISTAAEAPIGLMKLVAKWNADQAAFAQGEADGSHNIRRRKHYEGIASHYTKTSSRIYSEIRRRLSLEQKAGGHA